jgi:hypothetical protein
MSEQTEIPFLDGMKVGLGYDVLTGAANKSTAVIGAALTAPAQAGGQTVITTLRIVQESSVLHQTLGVSVDASVGNLYGDLSAKFKFASDIAVNSFSLYVVVGVEVFNAVLTLDDPVLSPAAEALLRTRNPRRFRDRFGDRFILGIKTGGEYFAVYKVQSFDEEERTTVAAQVHARFGAPPVAGGSLDAEVSDAISKSKHKLDVSVYVYQAGGGNINTETTLDAIMQKARVFPTLVGAAQAVPYSMLLHDYSELRLPDDSLSFVDIQNQQDTLKFNARLLSGFDAVVNDIDFIRQNIDQFKKADGTPVDDLELAKVRKSCLEEMDAIRVQMSKCSNDATACVRIQVAPEDFAKLLPRIGDSSRTVVPDLRGLGSLNVFRLTEGSITELSFHFVDGVDTQNPFTAQTLKLRGEFGAFQYLADLAPDDMLPGLQSGLFVKEQDPLAGSVVSRDAVVKLKLQHRAPPG